MTCKDCVHEKVCKNAYSFKVTPPNVCGYFKNKADFVEVRCKDCAYYAPLGDAYEYKGKKAMHCILRASCTGDNYYCADGIRKSVTDINVGDK